jgi:hypothetical protein
MLNMLWLIAYIHIGVALIVYQGSPFWSQLITSNFPSVPAAFRQFFTWIAQGDVDLGLWLILVRKGNVLEDKNYKSQVIVLHM